MRLIPLYRGQRLAAWATISDDDDPDVVCWLWRLHPAGYAVRYESGTGRTVLMHRQIMGLKPGDRREVDHKDANGLNNQRDNLRVGTRAQNMQNVPARGRTSQHRGVSWNSQRGKWVAQVKAAGRMVYCVHFDDELDAARAAAEQRAIHLPFANPERDLIHAVAD